MNGERPRLSTGDWQTFPSAIRILMTTTCLDCYCVSLMCIKNYTYFFYYSSAITQKPVADAVVVTFSPAVRWKIF